MPSFTAAAVPHFTLYGDGTVIFRNPMLEAPPAEGSVFKMNPLRTAKLSEEQIQDLLQLALAKAASAPLAPSTTNDMIADASTAIFTIEAGGLKKIVSVYALGLEMEGMVDGPARAAFKKLADRLTDFDQGGTHRDRRLPARRPTAASCSRRPASKPPTSATGPGPTSPPADFKPDADPNGNQFPHRKLTPDEVDLLGIDGLPGRAPERRPHGPTASRTRSACGRSSRANDRRLSPRSGGSCHRVPRGLRSLRRRRLTLTPPRAHPAPPAASHARALQWATARGAQGHRHSDEAARAPTTSATRIPGDERPGCGRVRGRLRVHQRQPVTMFATTTSSLRATRCALPGCGQPRSHAVHVRRTIERYDGSAGGAGRRPGGGSARRSSPERPEAGATPSGRTRRVQPISASHLY